MTEFVPFGSEPIKCASQAVGLVPFASEATRWPIRIAAAVPFEPKAAKGMDDVDEDIPFGERLAKGKRALVVAMIINPTIGGYASCAPPPGSESS